MVRDTFLQICKKPASIGIYLSIAFAATALRFWGLDELPATLYRDESWNGVEGLLTLYQWDFRPFYEGSTGREGMLIWLIALTHVFMEPSAFSVRFSVALIGTLTVIALPFLLRQLLIFFYVASYRQEPTNRQHHIFWVLALGAMFFLATSYWHLNFSRITFRAILDPFLCLAACSFVAMSYRYHRQFWLAALSGCICGLGLYGYGSFKFTAIPLFVIFIYALVLYRSRVLVPTCLIIIFTLLAALPLIQYIMQHSDSYFLRLNQVSVFRKEEPLAVFLDSLTRMLGMLGGIGDGNLRHNHNQNAQLNPVFFASFIFGFCAVIATFLRPSKNQRWLKHLGIFLLIWFTVMLVPSALTYEGQPHSLRAIGLLMPIAIFAGVAVASVYSLIYRQPSYAANSSSRLSYWR